MDGWWFGGWNLVAKQLCSGYPIKTGHYETWGYLPASVVYARTCEPQDIVVGSKQAKVVITYHNPWLSGTGYLYR